MKHKFYAEIIINPDGEVVIKNLSGDLLDLAVSLNPRDKILQQKRNIKRNLKRGK